MSCRGEERSGGGVLVANPGGISWMIRLAAIFAEHGELAAYCSPATFRARDLDVLERRLPRWLSHPLVSQLRLRSVPEPVSAEQIVRAGTTTEVAYVMGIRTGLPRAAISQLDHLQARSFDRGASHVIRPELDAVIGYQGTSVRSFEHAARHRVPRVLDYPIPHYVVCERLLSEEVKRVPAYAGTMQGHEIEGWRKGRYEREIEAADRMIMISTYHRRTFEAVGIDPARLFVAHLGVDLDLFSPGTVRHRGPFRVLFCGQISQRKGISYLVEAFRLAALEDAELVFAGRPVGGPHPWMKEPRVRHIPALPRPKLADVYRSADVIVLPSLIEGFGATVLEGMACGLPAIVSENTLAHDVIEDGVDGWVTPIRDPEAIAAYLRALYEDRDLLDRMGQAARRKAEQFPWSRYGAELRGGVADLLHPAGGRAS